MGNIVHKPSTSTVNCCGWDWWKGQGIDLFTKFIESAMIHTCGQEQIQLVCQ